MTLALSLKIQCFYYLLCTSKNVFSKYLLDALISSKYVKSDIRIICFIGTFYSNEKLKNILNNHYTKLKKIIIIIIIIRIILFCSSQKGYIIVSHSVKQFKVLSKSQ